MSRFAPGLLVAAGVLAAASVVFMLFRAHHNEACDDLNYTVWAFERCMEDSDSRCFITSDHVERYDRATTQMKVLGCQKWESDTIEIELAPGVEEKGT